MNAPSEPTKDDLIEEAKERGIHVTTHMTKPEIEEALAEDSANPSGRTTPLPRLSTTRIGEKIRTMRERSNRTPEGRPVA